MPSAPTEDPSCCALHTLACKAFAPDASSRFRPVLDPAFPQLFPHEVPKLKPRCLFIGSNAELGNQQMLGWGEGFEMFDFLGETGHRG